MPITGVMLTSYGERLIKDESLGLASNINGLSMRRLCILAVCKPNNWHTVDAILDRVRSALAEPIQRDDIVKGLTFLSEQQPALVDLAHKSMYHLSEQIETLLTKSGGGLKWSDLMHGLRRPDTILPSNLEQQVLDLITTSSSLKLLHYNNGTRRFVYVN